MTVTAGRAAEGLKHHVFPQAISVTIIFGHSAEKNDLHDSRFANRPAMVVQLREWYLSRVFLNHMPCIYVLRTGLVVFMVTKALINPLPPGAPTKSCSECLKSTCRLSKSVSPYWPCICWQGPDRDFGVCLDNGSVRGSLG